MMTSLLRTMILIGVVLSQISCEGIAVSTSSISKELAASMITVHNHVSKRDGDWIIESWTTATSYRPSDTLNIVFRLTKDNEVTARPPSLKVEMELLLDIDSRVNRRESTILFLSPITREDTRVAVYDYKTGSLSIGALTFKDGWEGTLEYPLMPNKWNTPDLDGKYKLLIRATVNDGPTFSFTDYIVINQYMHAR